MATGATTVHGDLNTKHNYIVMLEWSRISVLQRVTSWQETASGAMKPIVPIAQKK